MSHNEFNLKYEKTCWIKYKCIVGENPAMRNNLFKKKQLKFNAPEFDRRLQQSICNWSALRAPSGRGHEAFGY